MIKICCEKTNHTLYEMVNNALNILSLELDINIVGVDSVLSSPFNRTHMSEFTKKPFFLYVEEPEFINMPDIVSHKHFRGFISHIKNTCEQLYNNYNNKTYYLPLYMEKKDVDRVLSNISSLKNREHVNLIAWGSWNDFMDGNFYNRGGNVVDDLVSELLRRKCKIHLTFKTNKSLKCKSAFPDNVNIVNNYLAKEQMDNMFYDADMFLLPSKQVHSMSLLYSMSFGLPCIVSDGWGMSEFCSDLNSIIHTDIDKITGIVNDRDRLIHLRKQVLFDLNNRYNQEDYVKRLSNILQDSM